MDVAVEPRGSLILIRPVTEAARKWIEENVAVAEPVWFAGRLACEARFAPDLLAGMTEDGLEVVLA